MLVEKKIKGSIYFTLCTYKLSLNS